jgi:hypothetical protein
MSNLFGQLHSCSKISTNPCTYFNVKLARALFMSKLFQIFSELMVLLWLTPEQLPTVNRGVRPCSVDHTVKSEVSSNHIGPRFWRVETI